MQQTLGNIVDVFLLTAMAIVLLHGVIRIHREKEPYAEQSQEE